MPAGVLLSVPAKIARAAAILLVLATGAVLVWMRTRPLPENQRIGSLPEKVVFVRSSDDVVSGGVAFSPAKQTTKPVAIIWIHGWGANFYSPTYIGIGRALAERGFTAISGNTRMHDIANVEKYLFSGTRIRGGGYWGVTSEAARDIRAWIDFAESQGFARVVLVGHSAGWADVAAYEAESRDGRVAGMVLASGNVRHVGDGYDKNLLEQARRLVDEGKGDELLRLPNRSFASYISAATYADLATIPVSDRDFFGTTISDPPVARIGCPVLAFFGTREREVGGQEDLDVLNASMRKRAPDVRVVTTMIDGADHEYVGHEPEVAQTIAQWADTQLLH